MQLSFMFTFNTFSDERNFQHKDNRPTWKTEKAQHPVKIIKTLIWSWCDENHQLSRIASASFQRWTTSQIRHPLQACCFKHWLGYGQKDSCHWFKYDKFTRSADVFRNVFVHNSRITLQSQFSWKYERMRWWTFIYPHDFSVEPRK